MTLYGFQIVKHSTSFQYRDRKVKVTFYVKEDTDVVVDTILFLGTGQVGKIPRWVAANMPNGVVVVEGLPHWESQTDGSDLVAFSHSYTQTAFEAILKTFKCSAMHIIGSSQAAPSTIWLANSKSGKVKNIALVLPMGLNTAYFGANDKDRFKELRKRALLTMLQKDQHVFSDLRNMHISLTLIRIILAGIGDGSTVKKYTVGISEDMTEATRRLIARQKQLHRKLLLYIGENDKVFPPNEIRQSLSKAGIYNVSIVIMPNVSHSSLAMRKYRIFWME
jgi:pimeloyl-ACP methyl ester carboxylesterase